MPSCWPLWVSFLVTWGALCALSLYRFKSCIQENFPEQCLWIFVSLHGLFYILEIPILHLLNLIYHSSKSIIFLPNSSESFFSSVLFPWPFKSLPLSIPPSFVFFNILFVLCSFEIRLHFCDFFSLILFSYFFQVIFYLSPFDSCSFYLEFLHLYLVVFFSILCFHRGAWLLKF